MPQTPKEAAERRQDEKRRAEKVERDLAVRHAKDIERSKRRSRGIVGEPIVVVKEGGKNVLKPADGRDKVLPVAVVTNRIQRAETRLRDLDHAAAMLAAEREAVEQALAKLREAVAQVEG
jgi:hypothetical protein